MHETPTQTIERKLLERIEILASISSDLNGTTRVFLSKEMDTAAKLIRLWMNNAGLVANIDPLQNVVGSWPSENAVSPSINIGSHFDTVINAGRFDGMLGLLLSISAVEILQQEGYTPKHHINVLGFCDEEGVRFHTTFLGSSYLSGTFDISVLEKRDESGITMADALSARGVDPSHIAKTAPIIRPDDVFIEAHIEQGPALEALNVPLGIVSGIAAQMRIQVKVTGKAGHAGTTPANLRQDALTAAAEMVLLVEEKLRKDPQARATVGQLYVSPNSSNAIPGEVQFAIDLRYPNYESLLSLREELLLELKKIANNREVGILSECIQETPACVCDESIQSIMIDTVSKLQDPAPTLLSGAGHDTLKIAQTCRTGMMFIRCREGLSHHPDEYTSPEDIRAALKAWVEIIRSLDQKMEAL